MEQCARLFWVAKLILLFYQLTSRFKSLHKNAVLLHMHHSAHRTARGKKQENQSKIHNHS